MPSESLYVGVDGGATKTIALLARNIGSREVPQLDILRRGEGGPSNPNTVGLDAAAAAIADAIRQAIADTGRTFEALAGICAGVAGAGSAEKQNGLRDRLNEHGIPAHVLDVTSDLMLLFENGTPAGWGIVVISGTGSVAFGKTTDGRTARAGGWGYKFDDPGSAYALAIEALRAVARSADGRGPETALTPLVLRELGVNAPNEIIGSVYAPSATPDSIARLGRLVFEAAKQEDTVAFGILERATSELAEAARAVAHTLGMTTEPFPLALAGTLFLEQEEYLYRFIEKTRAHRLQPEPVKLVREPARGALTRALRLTGSR